MDNKYQESYIRLRNGEYKKTSVLDLGITIYEKKITLRILMYIGVIIMMAFIINSLIVLVHIGSDMREKGMYCMGPSLCQDIK